MAVSGIAVAARDCKRRLIPFQLFGCPKNSKSPVQHVQQKVKTALADRSINSNHPTALQRCRAGAFVSSGRPMLAPCTCRGVLSWRLCFCSNRQSDPSVPIGLLTRLRPDLRYRGFQSHRSAAIGLNASCPPRAAGAPTSGDDRLSSHGFVGGPVDGLIPHPATDGKGQGSFLPSGSTLSPL